MGIKEIHIRLSTVVLTFLTICIIIMGYHIFNLSSSKKETDNQLKELRSEMQNVQISLGIMQGTSDNSNVKINAVVNEIDSNTQVVDPKTEKQQVEETAKSFEQAVNNQDWNTLEKITTTNVINALKTYNVTNMDIDTSLLEKDPNKENAYYCFDSYDIDYKGTDKKDLGLGGICYIEKIEETFKITSFYVTGL